MRDISRQMNLFFPKMNIQFSDTFEKVSLKDNIAIVDGEDLVFYHIPSEEKCRPIPNHPSFKGRVTLIFPENITDISVYRRKKDGELCFFSDEDFANFVLTNIDDTGIDGVIHLDKWWSNGEDLYYYNASVDTS